LAQENGRGKRFLKRHLAKLTFATPLAQEASGLVVFTQDWRVARKLIDEASRTEHEYLVEAAGHIDDASLAAINRQLKASRQSEGRLRFAGKNISPAQIDTLCAEAGVEVRAIRRLRIGRVPMAGLPAGRWRYLHETERF
jgi:23S rRNA pseudouridine2604 synthase